MKKLFLGVALAAGSLAFAQQFGIKGGLNVSSLSKDGFADAKSKAGFYAGAFVNVPISESFSIQPEVVYNNIGAKVTLLGTENNLNLNYISIPVMFQYNATPQFYVEAGPEFSFLLNSKIKSSSALLETIANSLNSNDFYNTFNFGLGVGAGFNITNNIGVNARYVAGFTDATKGNSTISNLVLGNNKNNVFQVGLNYKF